MGTSTGSSSWSWICCCLVSVAFFTGATVNAQSRNFHLDYVLAGQGTRIVLVNESPNNIEAIRLAQDCSLSRINTKTDVLDLPEHSGPIRDAAGNPARSIGPQPGGTWDLFYFQNSEKSKYVGECAFRVEFILFGDGTYEGKESYARYLKTHRDGMFASIIEWLEILNRQDAGGFDVASLQKLASKRRDEDQQKVVKYCKPGQSD